MGQVGQEASEFHHLTQAATGRRGHRGQVPEHLPNLLLDAPIHQGHGRGHQGDLTGEIDRVSDPDRLGIGPDGAWGLVCTDDLSWHRVAPHEVEAG